MGLLGAASTAAANALAHTLTFALNLALFTNMCQYLYNLLRRSASPQRSHCANFAPFYLMLTATVLVLTDLLRHVLMDAKSVYLLDSSTGRHLSVQADACVYEIPLVLGSRECVDRYEGPLELQEERAFEFTRGWRMYDAEGGLTWIGWLVTVGCTWSGMILMMTSLWLARSQKQRTLRSAPLLRSE